MKEVISELKKLKGKVLILTHHNADLDAIASSIALSLGLKQKNIASEIGVAESVSRGARKLVKDLDIKIDPDCKNYDKVILIETSVPEQVASVKNIRADIVIDHHPPGKLAKGVVWIDPNYKSTAQMILKILEELGCKIDKNIAKIIGAGIVADTAHLRLADLEVFQDMTKLLKTGIKFEDILKTLETPIDISENIAKLKAAKRIEAYRIGDILVVTSVVGSHEAAAARGMLKLGADVAVIAGLKDNEIRFSSRGKRKILEYNIDLSEIFKEVGPMIEGSGGGHDLAGSANGKRKDKIDEVFKFILKKISEKIGKKWKKL